MYTATMHIKKEATKRFNNEKILSTNKSYRSTVNDTRDIKRHTEGKTQLDG